MDDKDYTTPETWFGVWPPELRRQQEGVEMSNPCGEKESIKWGIILILLGIGVLGVLLVGLSEYFNDVSYLSEILLGIGIALITTTALGLTIDRFLKKELSKEAVKSTLGYMLPEALRGEMGSLVGIPFLAIEHSSEYEIMPNGDGQTVTLTCDMKRKLCNFTNTAQDIMIAPSIDENGFDDKPSAFLNVTYWLEGSKRQEELDTNKTKLDEGALVLNGENVKVPAHKWIEIKTKFQETRRINDVFFMVFRFPTVEPRLVVKAGTNVEYRKGYAHRKGKLGEDDKLSGVLLPEQAEYIRWWIKGGRVDGEEKSN